ncbi:hypothetical protein ES706_05198 [subsurface metagenome]
MNNDKGKREAIKERLWGLTEEEDIQNERAELIKEYDRSTVDHVIGEMRKRGDLPEKPGKSLTRTQGGFYPIKVGKGEIIAPEAALRDIRLQDGDYKLGFVDGMGVLIMAARYNQILAASQAEVLSNQLKIMEESRKGSAEVAQEAAARAAALVGAQIMPEVEALKNQITASSPNPMMSMFTTAMQPYLGQVIGNVMGMFQPRQPAQPGQPGAPLPPPQPPQPVGQQASQDEVKEAFNDE